MVKENRKFSSWLTCAMTLLVFVTSLTNSSWVSAKTGAGGVKKAKICVYDLAGSHGPVFNYMKAYQIEALAWGSEIELKAYTEEKIAAEDFKAGQCDGVVLTGLRSRAFNKFTGTVNAFGALPTVEHLRYIMKAVSNPKLAKRLKNGDFEIAGMLPVGGVYLFVNDRKINTPAEFAGKKIATMDYDEAQMALASQIGASPISVDITNFAGKFNNGSVDICGAPAEGYNLLELYKGLTPNGGILRVPVLQLSAQLVLHSERFPEGYGQKSREYFYSLFDQRIEQIAKVKNDIDKKWWVDIAPETVQEYNEMTRRSRVELMKAGVYDANMLKLMKRVRCRIEPTLSECSDRIEG